MSAEPLSVAHEWAEGQSAVDVFLNADCLRELPLMTSGSIHAVITDIPYGIGAEEWDVLHSNTNSAFLGCSPAQTKASATFARRGKPINGWSSADRNIGLEYQNWCSSWAAELLRVLKPGGSLLVFAGRRFVHRCAAALEDAGFSIKDQLAWVKPAAPHRAQRLSVVFDRRRDYESAEEWEGWRLGNLRPRFEPILWATKPYKIGTTIADNVLHHGVGAMNPEAIRPLASDYANILEIGMAQHEERIHPTQKPLGLMRALVELVTVPGQVVLDPFAGSGTTLAAAAGCGRRYVGYEINGEYYRAARARLYDAPLRLL
ncbi:MAG: site-specific DNA-methyltransferase [Bifidobacteriaceae bacterium]|jgi:site-specific DNA-methyltransferase (adenine-specific)|nr:site-specific DNA-methyltransferase [Bifidobacteriaceae bacterium]